MASKAIGRDVVLFRSRPRPVSELSELSELSKQTATIPTRKSVTEEVCESRISTLIEFQRPFMAGQLQNYIANWQRITSDPFILDVVAHCHIDFEDEPLLSSNIARPHEPLLSNNIARPQLSPQYMKHVKLFLLYLLMLKRMVLIELFSI